MSHVILIEYIHYTSYSYGAVEMQVNTVDNQQYVIVVIAQHMGFTLKEDYPSNYTIFNDEQSSHTLFIETKPLSFKDTNSWFHFS